MNAAIDARGGGDIARVSISVLRRSFGRLPVTGVDAVWRKAVSRGLTRATIVGAYFKSKGVTEVMAWGAIQVYIACAIAVLLHIITPVANAFDQTTYWVTSACVIVSAEALGVGGTVKKGVLRVIGTVRADCHCPWCALRRFPGLCLQVAGSFVGLLLPIIADFLGDLLAFGNDTEATNGEETADCLCIRGNGCLTR